MMRRSRKLQTTRIAIAAALAAPLVANCSVFEGGKARTPTIDTCPSELEKIVEGRWGLQEASDSQIRAALLATYYTESLAFRIEGEVEKGCKEIATALGAGSDRLKTKAGEPGAEAKVYCEVATEVVDAAEKATTGDLTVEASTPDCSADMSLYEGCVKQCDPGFKIEPSSLECDGRVLGNCDGTCEGSCYSSVGKCTGTCDGKCTGKCDGGFKGQCDEQCTGSCDGKKLGAKAKGKCQGICEGSCTNGTGECVGTCAGNCSGKCQVEASGTCAGICSGHCDAKLTERVCEGMISVPDLSESCQLVCGTKGLGDQRCSDLNVNVRIDNGKKGEGEKLKATLYAHMPKLFAVANQLDKPAREYVEQSATLVKQMAAAVKKDPKASKKLKACTAQSAKNHQRASAGIVAALDALASYQASSGI